MATRRGTWRRRPVTLTPLIDVIFLLLLFFMLSSTFTRYTEIPLMNAGGGSADVQPPLFLQLSAETVALNGDAVALEQLAEAVEARRGDGTVQTLLVTVAADVSSQRLVDLLTGLGAVPGLSVSVLE